MLSVERRALGEGPARTDATLAPDDPLFADTDVRLAAPVEVRGTVRESGVGQYYWHATLRTTLAAACRRCLREVRVPIDTEVWALFAASGDGLEDAATYPISPRAAEVDVAPAVREELILEAPEYVLCREDCRGLCPRCGTDLNEGPCTCTREPDPRWAALEALKGRWPDHED